MNATNDRTVTLSYFTRTSIRQERIVRSLLDLLYHLAPVIAPQMFADGKRWMPVGPDNYEAIVGKWTTTNNHLLRRTDKYSSELAITTGFAATGRYDTMSYWVDEAYFDDASNVQEFLTLATAIYDLIHPAYGMIHETHDAVSMSTIKHPQYGKTLAPVNLPKGLPGIFWANIFGPEFVETIGLLKLQASPGTMVRELSDGGYMILTNMSPSNPSAEYARSQQKALRSYLGEGFFSHYP